jgi:hypothetical protein
VAEIFLDPNIIVAAVAIVMVVVGFFDFVPKEKRSKP